VPLLHELFAKRAGPAHPPEQFAAFFDPIARSRADVVLSCGRRAADVAALRDDHPDSPRAIRGADPFCTNGMLLSDKLAEAISPRHYMVMFSFDGIRSETLIASASARLRRADFCPVHI